MFEKTRGAPSEIYLELISKGHLSDQHREELKVKRGFLDSTIDALKFKSCGPHNLEIIEELKKKYVLNDIYQSGLVYNNQKVVSQLLDETKIIIPYLSADGSVITHIKCHKKGNLPNIGVEPYCHYLLSASPIANHYYAKRPYLILCESEFKAVALWQLGFNAIGLNGITAFAGENMHKLAPFINSFKKIIILFDNEIQDDPSLPSHKSEQYSRYAHFIWSYKMAVRIQRFFSTSEELNGKQVIVQPDVTIATLPKSWIGEDGKIDCDSAAAKGKGIEDFLIVMADSLTPDVYKSQLDIPKEDRPWVYRRLEQENRQALCFEKNCEYWTTTNDKNGEIKYNRISNFVIRHKNTIIKDGEVYREVYLKNNLTDISESFVLSAKHCSNYKDFKTHCIGRGDYMWHGSEKIFNYVIENMFLEHEAAPIYVLDQCGRNEAIGSWVFENVIIKDDKTILTKNKSEDGKTFIDSSASYRVLPLKSGGAIPRLSDKEIDIVNVFRMIKEVWGIQGVEGFAFIISTLFSNDIYDITQAFPILMIHGEREAGKSAMTDILAAIAGFHRDSSAQNISDTTNVALGRIMNYFSSLPVRFDEFRNDDQKTQIKTSIMRSLYNRQGASKGLRDSFGVREVNVRGCFILTGEEPPDDPALYSRVIPVHVKGFKNKITTDALKFLYDSINSLSYITYKILSNYRENREKFKNDFLATQAGLKMQMANSIAFNPRATNHYSMLMAALGIVLPEEEIIDVQKQLLKNFTSNTQQQQQSSLVVKFFSDVYTMKHVGEPISEYIIKPLDQPYMGIMYLKAVYDIYAQYKSRHGGLKQLCSERTIRDYIKNKPFCLSPSSRAQVKASSGAFVNCIVLDLSHPQCPKDLVSMFENIEEAPYNLFYNNEEKETLTSNIFANNNKVDSVPF